MHQALVAHFIPPRRATDPISVKLANNNKRRVTVSKYGGRWLVNVREYYEDKAGEMKPGKKVRLVITVSLISRPHSHSNRAFRCPLSNTSP